MCIWYWTFRRCGGWDENSVAGAQLDQEGNLELQGCLAEAWVVKDRSSHPIGIARLHHGFRGCEDYGIALTYRSIESIENYYE